MLAEEQSGLLASAIAGLGSNPQRICCNPQQLGTSMTVAPKQMRRKSNTSSLIGDAPVVIRRTLPAGR